MPRITPPGSLLRILLREGTDGFARVLPNSQIAVYDYLADRDQLVNAEDVYKKNIAFIVTVRSTAMSSKNWITVDQKQLEPRLAIPVYYFIQDARSKELSKYRSSDGCILPSTYDECRELEPASVWEAEHVEDRVRDHFAGMDNVWVNQLKPQLPTE